METGEDIIDKVRIPIEETKKLDNCFGSDGLPSFIDIDYAYLTAAISIEEALYKLSKFWDYYNVECVVEEFKEGKMMSFYLVNKLYPKERHWIVYNEPHGYYPYSIAVISLIEALYKLYKFEGDYIVVCVVEEFKGHKVGSFYLLNKTYPKEHPCIVYNNHIN